MSPLEEHFKLHRSPFPQAAEAQALLHHLGLKDALERLHFAIDRDGIALLSAESGCGKSTVLGCLSPPLPGISLLTELAPHALYEVGRFRARSRFRRTSTSSTGGGTIHLGILECL